VVGDPDGTTGGLGCPPFRVGSREWLQGVFGEQGIPQQLEQFVKVGGERSWEVELGPGRRVLNSGQRS
jgi:hypothetical protein